MSLPDYHFLPAPLWLVTILHLVTLTLHFAAMNVMVGGLIVVLAGRFNGRWHDRTVATFVKLFPAVMAATVTFGVAPLLFVQLVYPSQIYGASIVSAWFWFGIIAAAVAGYYLLYAASFSGGKAGGRPGRYLVLALLAFLYIAFVYSSVFSMAENPDLIRSLYSTNTSGAVINPALGAYLFRWLHMLLGALTVGAFVVGLVGRHDEQAFATGKRFFVWGMAAAMVAGLAYLFTLKAVLTALMNTPAVWLLLGAIVLSLLCLHLYTRKKFVLAGTGLFVSMLAMVGVRHTVRLIHLSGHYNPAALAIKPQWSVFIIFLICFVLAILAIGTMMTFVRSSSRVPESQ